ncbi:hypothetical protein THOM_0605 [Trachipleistophora hominis]|uniref:Uncharacterized protein n=1 Tax=Trachipleistophora hominis TaxID=72359 RepID=L7JY68_TRAHO|nr:hypothetical protein THOM_0605 [Trachipleistophora hominis]
MCAKKIFDLEILIVETKPREFFTPPKKKERVVNRKF